MSETYTDRCLEMRTAAKIEGAAVTDTGGQHAVMPTPVRGLIAVGTMYGLETKGGPLGTICGWQVDGRWIIRRTDQQIDADREDWARRSAELPHWIRLRLETFQDRGGERFEREGWGYEVIVAELAAMYHTSGGEDSETINDYADRNGTSGHQHDWARALARAHGNGEGMGSTVSALSPLTGDPFYEG